MKNVYLLYSDMYSLPKIFIERQEVLKHCHHISIGDLLREELKLNTELGNKIQSYLDTGELIPIELLNTLLEQSIQVCDTNIIITQNPRTLKQLNELKDVLDRNNFKIQKFIYLKIEPLTSLQSRPKKLRSPLHSKFKTDSNILTSKIIENRKQLHDILCYANTQNILRTIEIDFNKIDDLPHFFRNILI